jgi:hypothetical protein
MIRKVFVRRLVAIAIAVMSLVGGFVWMVVGKLYVERYAWVHGLSDVRLGPDANPQAGTGPTTGDMVSEVQTYYIVVMLAVWLAFGLATALIVLTNRRDFRIRMIIYTALLAILMPATYYNFGHAQGDFALRAPYQAALNIILIFLGLTICFGIRRWKPDAPDVKVLKTMIFTLLMFAAICIPTLLTLLWTLWRVNILTREAVDTISFPSLTALAGVVSASITVANYFRDQNSQPPQHEPKIIVVDH